MPQRLNMKAELANEATKAAPAVVGAAGTTILGLPLSEWAVIATISYIVLQAAYLVWKWRREHKAGAGQ